MRNHLFSIFFVVVSSIFLTSEVEASYVIQVVGGYDPENYVVDAGEPGESGDPRESGGPGGNAYAYGLTGAIAYGGAGGDSSVVGGLGGEARAYSSGPYAFALARGGEGGHGYERGEGGEGGAATTKATAYVASSNFQQAEARQIGGSGGAANLYGGDGADSWMVDAVSGGASRLSLIQTSVGGAGGLGNIGGYGGNARSALTVSN